MRRSLAILAVTAVCGGTVAIGTAAYSNDGATTDESGRTLSAWIDGLGGTVAADDSEPNLTCRLPKELPARPDLEGLPEGLPKGLPKPSDLPQLLHSEQAVQDRDSGEVTYQVSQLGKVTDRSEEALTVESADGTVWIWELTDDTTVYSKGREAKPSSLSTGDRVMVHGTRDGDTRRAATIGSPAPDIGLGVGPQIALPGDLDVALEDLGEALPDDLRDLPKLHGCEESQPKEGTGTGTAA